MPVDEVCVAAAREAAALIEELGHDVEPFSLPQSEEAVRLFAVIWATIPAVYPVEDASLLEPINRTFLEQARQTSSADYVRAYTGLQLQGRAFATACAEYDVVLTPTLAKPPVPIGWVREPDDPWEQSRRAGQFTPFTPPVNVAGLPAVSVPFAWTAENLPIGIQLVAASRPGRATYGSSASSSPSSPTSAPLRLAETSSPHRPIPQ